MCAYVCAEVFDTFGCSGSGLISFECVLHHIKAVNPAVDVWDLFGRSMLKETRRDSRAAIQRSKGANANKPRRAARSTLSITHGSG